MHLDKRLDNLNPINVLNHKKELLDNYNMRLNLLINNILNDKKNQFILMKNTLEANNPLKIMDKGYSISSVDEKVIRSINDVKKNDVITTRLKDGNVISQVIEVKKNG